jgi:hypothetical protein
VHLSWAPTLFLAIWLLLILGLLLCVAEDIARISLREWAFRRGFIVLRATLPATIGPPVFREGIHVTKSARYRLTTPDTALFSYRSPKLGRGLHTPVVLKGRIKWSGSSAEVVGRLPVALVVFQGAWVGLAVTFGLAVGFQEQMRVLWVVPLAIAFALLTGPAWIPFEKRRSMKAAAEIIGWNNAANAA